MDRTMQADEEAHRDQEVDVLFGDLVKDPVGSVRAIDARFGYALTAR